jgi:shikimate kinase
MRCSLDHLDHLEGVIVTQLYLIGYRGCGKSSVGPVLAGLLGRSFVDADAVLEADAGRSIRDIFATEGEGGFRDREEATIAKLAAGEPAVIATGGGAVLRAANRERMRATGFVAWLTAPADVLWARISADATTAERRPNLAGGGFAEVVALLAAREPLYAATAHVSVDATASPDAVAGRIFRIKNDFTAEGT